MNSHQKLLLVCDCTDQFISLSNEQNAQDEFIQFSILGCLLAAEEMFDKGRIVLSIENTNPDDKQLINRKIDELRKNIVEFLKKLSVSFGKEKVLEYLSSRARNIQGNWIDSF